MKKEELRPLLSRLNFSATLTETELDQLASTSRLVEFSADTPIFREGETHTRFYLLEQGRVALEIHVPGRGKTRIITLGPGEMFGWSALLGEGLMTTSAIALQDTRVVEISSVDLLRLCETEPQFGFRLMRRLALALSKRLTATRMQLLDLFADTPPKRPPQSGEES